MGSKGWEKWICGDGKGREGNDRKKGGKQWEGNRNMYISSPKTRDIYQIFNFVVVYPPPFSDQG